MPTWNPTSATGRTGTIQTWTVPSTGRYLIECHGAQGGAGNGYGAGAGAYRYGVMQLTANEVLAIIVGQMGTKGTSAYEGGGGGGSFVYRQSAVELLCAAGGGGGGSNNGAGGHGQTTEAGGVGATSGDTKGTPGTGGNGATAGYGAGGAGWNTTGNVPGWSNSSTGPRPGSACKPGATYDPWPSGATGQAYGGIGDTATNPHGGFGGGGGAHGNSYVAGGGGGGYSGGAASQSSGYGGGGGGSFVHANMTGTGGTVGSRTTSGLVVITLQNSLPGAPTGLTIPTPVFLGSSAAPSWTHVDSNGDPQNQYQLRWRTADV